MLIDFKDEDFENKIKSEDVSVIQFSAAWCGPCKALKPIMDKLADEYKDKDYVTAYRKYYQGAKAYFAKWQKGVFPPEWWVSA